LVLLVAARQEDSSKKAFTPAPAEISSPEIAVKKTDRINIF
jgi:hypothetical protein